MNIFVVIDSQFNINRLINICNSHQAKIITLFFLMDDYLFIEQLINDLNQAGFTEIVKLDSAKIIDDEWNSLQDKFCEWSYQLGEERVGSKSIKEWLVLPNSTVSTWWFSLLSEKNTMQIDTFLHIAQLHAIKRIIKNNGEFQLIVVVIANKTFQKALQNIIRLQHKSIIYLKSQQNSGGLKTKIRAILKNLGIYGHLALGFSYWLNLFINALRTGKHLRAINRAYRNSTPLLFITDFPFFDKASAEQGVFQNKLAMPLQHLMKGYGLDVTWLLFPVNYDGYTLKEILKFMTKFINNGERMFITYEFFDIKTAVKALFLWLRQALIGFYIFRRINKTYLKNNILGQECLPLIRDLWNLSFYGSVAVAGVSYYLIFLSALKKLSDFKLAIYYCEMQSWEKAFNAAKRYLALDATTLGYQHSGFNSRFLHLFYSPKDTAQTSAKTNMPLPDILAANGMVMRNLLQRSNYPNLIHLEAIRYLYLNKLLDKPIAKKNEDFIMLVAGGYRTDETLALIKLVHIAFANNHNFKIWFKSHPFTPVETLFQQLDIDINIYDYKIVHGDLDNYLPKASVVIAPSSTIAIEALALGCELIIPIFSSILFMNPIAEYTDYYHRVSNTDELRVVVDKIISGKRLNDIEAVQQLIHDLWDLNDQLPRWREVIINALKR